jgi:membrane protease YdiL (CAAX protease family)
MFTQLTNSAKAFLFFGIAFALTVSVSLLYPLLGGATLYLHMYTPTVAALLMLLVVTRDGDAWTNWQSLGLSHVGLRSWPLALLGPLAMMSIVYGLVWSTGVADVVMVPGSTLAGVPLSFAVGLVISSALALGEELGFRGYLLPRLLPLGTTRALLLTGLLHGLWHFPVLLLTPLLPIQGTWLIVGPIFLLTLTAAGVFYGYLQLTSGSVWPATLGHGAINVLLNLFSGFTIASSPLALEYLAGETGVVTLAVTALAAIWLGHRLQQRRGALATQLQHAGA